MRAAPCQPRPRPATVKPRESTKGAERDDDSIHGNDHSHHRRLPRRPHRLVGATLATDSHGGDGCEARPVRSLSRAGKPTSPVRSSAPPPFRRHKRHLQAESRTPRAPRTSHSPRIVRNHHREHCVDDQTRSPRPPTVPDARTATSASDASSAPSSRPDRLAGRPRPHHLEQALARA